MAQLAKQIWAEHRWTVIPSRVQTSTDASRVQTFTDEHVIAFTTGGLNRLHGPDPLACFALLMILLITVRRDEMMITNLGRYIVLTR